jgi:2,3-bisphosphoglycerate-dependent phosphoglycerate mutase
MVLDELDLLWLPIFKTWRLNERMYGSLTGLSKLMIGQKHGAEQLKLWRRSYSTRPPSVSSFSSKYPGNDERYMKNVRDIRVSIFESLIRSISHFNIEMHRKFPKTESLKDCMERTIPYYLGTIYPESIAKNKNVLIASSENAIRGLLMHLCEIPTDRISEVEIPTGLDTYICIYTYINIYMYIYINMNIQLLKYMYIHTSSASV